MKYVQSYQQSYQNDAKDNYHILPQDPTLGNNKLKKQAIHRFKKEKLITEKIADGLKKSDLRTRQRLTTSLASLWWLYC